MAEIDLPRPLPIVCGLTIDNPDFRFKLFVLDCTSLGLFMWIALRINVLVVCGGEPVSSPTS